MSQLKQFEGSDVRALLDEIKQAYGGDEPTISKAETFRTGGLLGFFQKERYRLTVEEQQASAAEERLGAKVTAPPAVGADLFESDMFDFLVAGTSDTNEIGAHSSGEAVTFSFADVLERVTVDPVAPPAPNPVPATPQTNREGSMADSLRRAGLPADLVASVMDELDSGRSLATALETALASRVAVPTLPDQARSLIVVAGPRHHALDAAAEISAQVGADPSQVLLASQNRLELKVPAERHIRSAEDAAALTPGVRRKHVAIVAVAIDAAGEGMAWADQVIGACQPTAVLAVADARQKNEDIQFWADSIGGVDALVIPNPGDTTSPGTALSLPTPVISLGGCPATAGGWARLILAQVAR